MRRHQKYFAVLNKIGGTRAIGARSCAIFNKGKNCDGHWHLIPKKPKSEPNGIRLIFKNFLNLLLFLLFTTALNFYFEK
jgi:hypothetical protein